MKLHELVAALNKAPQTFPRFVLPDGDHIPAHAHVTEVGHVVKNFIDCGGVTGKEEKVLLQTHVGNDTEHGLRSDRFSKILQLGERVLPNDELNVEVEHDCCVVAQYPISEINEKVSIWTLSCSAAGRSVAHVSAERPLQTRHAAERPQLVADGERSHSNLPMLMRSDTTPHPASSCQVAAVRVPFSGNSWRAAGKNFQAPRLSAQKGNGRSEPRSKLDDLFPAEETFARAGDKPNMSSRLRPVRCGL